MVELALTGIAAHSVRPLRFAIWLALGFAALGFLFVVYAMMSFLFVQHTVAGWSSIVAVIAILGAAQLLVLGIIGEYVGRILRETRKRPSYIVQETRKRAAGRAGELQGDVGRAKPAPAKAGAERARHSSGGRHLRAVPTRAARMKKNVGTRRCATPPPSRGHALPTLRKHEGRSRGRALRNIPCGRDQAGENA